LSDLGPRRTAPSSRWRGVFLFAALWLFSSAVTAGHFVARRSLSGDNLLDYSFFYNNIQSLHAFGEPAWWFPNTQMGYPGYFFSILGITNCGMPAFASVGLFAWVLGRLGIALPAMHTLYVFYFGALIPLLFLIGVWLVARQLFRSSMVVAYVLVVAAFSPGILTNLSDFGGLEHTAYALFFVAALVRFLRDPADTRSFLILGATLGLVALSFNYLFLVTAAPLLLCLAAMLLLHARFRSRAWGIARAQPAARWLLLVLLAALCAVPNVITLGHGAELGQRDTDALTYSFAQLKAGNPWELLLAGTPAVGLEWDHYFARPDGVPSQFVPQGLFKAKDHISYSYLGLLAWPLALAGFVGGRFRLRAGLLVSLGLLGSVLLLSAYSPLFASVLVFPTPLRGMNHFSDLLYRDGGFLVLLFAAGLGLECLQRTPGRRREIVFALVAGAAMAVTAMLHGFELSLATGFPVFIAFLIGIVLVWHRRSPARRQRQLCLGLLVALTLVDVSTMALWYERLALMPHGWAVTDALHADGLGIAQPRPNRGSDRALHYRSMTRLLNDGLAVDELPLLEVYGAAHFHADSPGPADFVRAQSKDPAVRSLALAPNAEPRAALEAVFRSPASAEGADARLEERTFNSMRVSVETGAPALVFVRDAFSPYWSATVNGAPVPIFRAFGNFKAFPVPAGRSDLQLRFAPGVLGPSIGLAYAIVLALGLAALSARQRGTVAARGTPFMLESNPSQFDAA
jgi:hypothetical protein